MCLLLELVLFLLFSWSPPHFAVFLPVMSHVC
jgi:hypothetical protein